MQAHYGNPRNGTEITSTGAILMAIMPHDRGQISIISPRTGRRITAVIQNRGLDWRFNVCRPGCGYTADGGRLVIDNGRADFIALDQSDETRALSWFVGAVFAGALDRTGIAVWDRSR